MSEQAHTAGGEEPLGYCRCNAGDSCTGAHLVPPALPAEKGERRIGGWTYFQWEEWYRQEMGCDGDSLSSGEPFAQLLAAAFAAPPPAQELSPAPCSRCGYNGPGYYQSETHPCAAPPPAEQEEHNRCKCGAPLDEDGSCSR